MTELFIIVYRHSVKEGWEAKTNGTFTERRLAENYAEILKAQRFAPHISIVDGILSIPETATEADARLGQFV